jgi:GDPmannose 4,6-dehydratase
MAHALLTGITGQDGTYLAQRLLGEGCAVFGTVRPGDDLLTAAQELLPEATFLEADLQDEASLRRAVEESAPTEVYNLAAFSEPGKSWQQPELTADITGLGVVRLLEALRQAAPEGVRFCQASSSEVFGRAERSPQDESTPLWPVSPYGTAKAFAHHTVRAYREAYGMFACNAVLYNHESPRRGEAFVTRKITRGVAAISLGLQDEIRLGNLDVQRDWGHAADYVAAMAAMLRADQPGDYVVATGRLHSLRDFLDAAFAHVGIHDWTGHVVQDPAFFRPADADPLVGDATRAREVLGWEPTRTFEDLVAEMVQADVDAIKLSQQDG